MPGLTQKNDRFSNGSTPMLSLCSSNGFWSKHSDKVNYNQLQKFWNELSPQARQELLRIDKQTLFEQARKNLYCSRCNGLLLEGFLQIIMYAKSLQQEGTGGNLLSNRLRVPRNQNDCELIITGGRHDEILDPSIHSWGGLTTTRDGSLTLMDCYLYSKSLKGLQNVFDSARAREREREMLYPDACGVGGRGWISQGMAGYGRGHGIRETCALHTARLSCDTLVDFWSALGDETRHSLLRMKEEDFIERLMYRFDSKRFCRDCRRNVIREFKELKELKRLRKEPHCTTWFCGADTAFQYEVSYDTVEADWCDTFADIVGTYHHFEWAVGTGEGKCDILEFENVGLNGSVNVNGLDLSGLSSCFITLRAWKLDGRCTELCVKAHALNAGQCVHCRLVVGDGFVTIKSGESIRRFFELAEEAEEEEDDDSMDKDGNEIDGDCSRPQKHAKSPELAREFLLDVATVIFKEQVEKAFREGTARQNAHSIFVSLALKLLEERVHVACKEIITLEKQMKLLEEEEKEKREEEERKERRRAKEREKKLRRKERLKGKEKTRNKNGCEENQNPDFLDVSKDESLVNIKEPNSSLPCKDSVSEVDSVQSRPGSPQIQEQQFSKNDINSTATTSSHEEATDVKDGLDSWTVEQSKTSHCRLRLRKQQVEPSKWPDRYRYAVSENGGAMNKSEPRYYGASFESPLKAQISNRHLRLNGLNSNLHHCGPKHNEKFQCSGSRMPERNGIHNCCDHNNGYRAMIEPHVSAVGVGREVKSVAKSDYVLDMSKQFYRDNKYHHIDHIRDICGRQKGKVVPGIISSGRDLIHPKKVWEPVESRKKYPRSNSDSDVTLKSSAFNVRGAEPNNNLIKLSGCVFSGEIKENSNETKKDNKFKPSRNSALESDVAYQNGLDRGGQPSFNLKETANEEIGSSPECSALKHVKSASSVTSPPMSSTSSSDNCSSCLSEGDSNTVSSNNGNQDSSTSDSEDSSQLSEGKETTVCNQNDFSECHSVRMEKNMNADGGQPNGSNTSDCLSKNGAEHTMLRYPPTNTACGFDNKFSAVSLCSQHPRMVSPMHNQNIQFPMFQTPTLGYYSQNPVPWPAATDELMPFPHPSHYMYTNPLGFGINGNSSFCMPCGSVQHLATTLYAPGHVPIYQSIPEANGFNMEEKASVPCSMREASNVADIEQCRGPVGQQSTQGASDGEGLQNDDSGKWHTSNGSFSLFHFGGPVALSTGSKSNPLLSKDEKVGEFSSKCPADPVYTDNAYNNKGTTVEEYNLFAANNGIKFSIF